MKQRFVVVPANPVKARAVHAGTRVSVATVTAGFDIYDNEDKRRLDVTYPTLTEADAECMRLNETLQPR
jgi:hypothetical protein